PNPSIVRDSLIAGNDLIFGDGPNSTDGGAEAPQEQFRDLIFGDHGEVRMEVKDPNLPPVELQRIQTTELILVTEVIGVGSNNGGRDTISGGEGQDIIMGGAGDDEIDTGQLQNLRDVVFGDNGRVTLNGSETFEAPSAEDQSGEEFTILNFNLDSRPGKATVDGIAGTPDSVSENGLPAPRSGNWNNLARPSGLFGNDAGELITDENGTEVTGLSVGWRIKNTDQPAYFDEDFSDGLGYSPDDYDPQEELYRTEDDYLDDALYDDNEPGFDAHREIKAGQDQDKRLFEGYAWGKRRDTIEIVIEGLDDHFVEYDFYLYMDTDNNLTRNDTDGVQKIRIGSDTQNRFFLSDPENNRFQGEYIRATSTNKNIITVGNYVAAGGLTDGRLVIEISSPSGNGNRPAVSGFQIVGKSHPIDRAESVDIAAGGNDAIYTGGGDDVIFGGTGNDWIESNGDADVGHLDFDAVFGDNGRATFMLTPETVTPEGGDIGELRDLVTLTTDEALSFDDVIQTGNGEDLVLGGQGGDCIHTGDTGVHNAVDDALSGDDIVAVGLNFASGVSEGFVEGTLGYVASDNWENLDTGSLGDFFDPADGLDDLEGFKGNEVERFLTNDGLQVRVGTDLNTVDERRAVFRENQRIDPDTQNGRLFNGAVMSTFAGPLSVEIKNLDQKFGANEPYDVYLYIDKDQRSSLLDNDIQLIAEDGTIYTISEPWGLEFNRTLVANDPNNQFQQANVFVFKDVIGDEFEVKLLKEDGRNRPIISGLQIVAGSDKDNIVAQGDFDTDRILGDQGQIRVWDRQAFEVISEVRGVTDAVDAIWGGDDGDLIIGGDGMDFLYGEDGDDYIVGDHARARLFDGDVIQYDVPDITKVLASQQPDSPDFDPFSVTGLQLVGVGIGGGDVIEGGRGDDVAYGGHGDDTYVFAGERLGSDFVVESGTFDPVNDPDDDGDGTAGIDVPVGLINDTGDALDFSGFNAGIVVELQDVSMQSYQSDVILGDLNGAVRIFSDDAIEDVTGSEFTDYIRGNDRNNAFLGLGGDDEIATGIGHDFADGGDGDDLIWMGLIASFDEARDFVVPGFDEFSTWRHVALGGDGDDRLHLSNGIDLALGGAGADFVLGGGFEGEQDFDPSQPGDILFGGDDTDRIRGGRGNDTMLGNQGFDFVTGEPGDFTLEESLPPAQRDALIAARLAEFEIAAGRSDFIFAAAPGEDLAAKVAPFVATIPAPERCPEEVEVMALMAASTAEGTEGVETVSLENVETVLEAARALWLSSGHLDAAQMEALDNVTVELADLGGNTLALYGTDDKIRVDLDAAGHSWHVDI
ncbi:MAG: calcium-binding protein, partial [Pseudomonadota bacterium]